MKINEMADILREGNDFLLLTHTRPDGDTLCSAAALCSALRRAGKRAWLYPNPEITENFRIFTDEWIADECTDDCCTVAVDIADTGMLPIGFAGKTDICIDHHGSNGHYAESELVLPEKASCGEIILEVIESLCGGLTKKEADLVYVAISTDTGCFCYGNTKADTLRAAARVVDYGAENDVLNKLMFRSLSFSRLKLEGLIYAGMRSYRNNSINVAIVTLDMMKQSGATQNDCDDLASLAGKVKGSVVAITIRELSGDRCKASVRTNELVNASDVCARFGGGGHAMAAGCTMEMSVGEAEKALLKAVDEVWK